MNSPSILLSEKLLPERSIRDLFQEPSAIARVEPKAGKCRKQQVTTGSVLGRSLIFKTYWNARRGLEWFRPLRLTRAWRSYHAANRLRAAGIATPLPQFLVLWEGSLTLACDRIDGEQLYELIRQKEWIDRNSAQLVQELSAMFDKLDRAMITHGDLHPRNILVDRRGQIWLVDLDGMHFHRSRESFARKRCREENRLAGQLEMHPKILAQLGFRRMGSHWTLHP